MQYITGKSWFFPQLGRHAEPGERIELAEDVAENYMRNEPGLLKPAPRTTQAKPKVTRQKRKSRA